MPVAKTVYQMEQRLRSFIPNFHQSHVRNLASMVVGMVYARAVTLPRVAVCVPNGRVQVESRVERFERVLACRKFVPLEVLKPLATRILKWMKRRGHPIVLIMDRSFINDTLNLLHVAVGFGGRALPLGWVHVPHEGNSDLALQKEILTWVSACLPPDTPVTLLADREFHSIHLAHWLATETTWKFVLRIKAGTHAMVNGEWTRAGRVAIRGLRTFHQNVRLTRSTEDLRPVNFATVWEHTEAEPWLLMTNLTNPVEIQKLYDHRYWIEEMFSDHKSRGLNLEDSRVTDSKRLQRLLVAVCFAYAWLMELGCLVIHRGLRRYFDARGAKRSVSLCQLGLRFLQDTLMQGIGPPLFTAFSPNFLKS
jgi:hypothetical protein